VEAIPRIGGTAIKETMVAALVDYINDEAPFHATPSLRRSGRKSPLLHPFWKALGAMERAGEPIIQSLKWRRKLLAETLSKHGFSPATPDLADDLEKLETILRLVRELRASMFTARYGKRSVRWHDVAAAVAPLVVDIYRAAGRKTVDFPDT
jgi:hypothetical protein